MKKLIAKMLVLVMVLSYVIPPNYVFAAPPPPGLTVDTKRSMELGVSNSIPTIIHESTQTSLPPNQIFYEWNLGSNNFEQYQLEYFLEDGKRVTFDVIKNFDYLNVEYTVFKDVAGAWVPINSALSPPTTGNFQVYSDKGMTQGRYVGIVDYLSNSHNPNNPTGVVNFHVNSENNTFVGTPPAPYVVTGTVVQNFMGDYMNPIFKVQADQGFSFRYDTAEVHFRWDRKDNSFQIVTDQIKPGFIYTGNLAIGNVKSIAGIGGPFDQLVDPNLTKDTKFVNGGIDTTKVLVTPTANNGRDVTSIIDATLPTPDDNPGSPDVGLGLSIPIPLVWDPINKKFDEMQTVHGSIYDFPLSVYLGNYDAERAVMVTVKDIIPTNIPNEDLNATAGNVNLTTRTGALDSIWRNGNFIDLKIKNMAAASLFHETIIDLSGLPDLISKKSYMPYATVFTFLNYRIITQNGKFYVSFTPYKDVPGEYMLHHAINPGGPYESVDRQNSDGSRTVLLPISLNSTSQFDAYFQVFFSPQKDFENHSIVGKIFSQKYHYKATVDKNNVSIPEMFYISPGYYQVPVEGYYDRDFAELFMTANWDIGIKDIIDELVDKSPGKVLTVIYNLNNALTPDEQNPTNFSQIEVQMTGTGLGNPISVTYRDINGTGEVLNTGSTTLKTQRIPGSDDVFYVASVDMKIETSYKDGGRTTDLYFPNIYFLNVEPVMQNGVPLLLGPSLYDSITLNDLTKLELPPAQNLECIDVTTTTVDPEVPGSIDEVSLTTRFTLSGEKLKDYLEHAFGLPPANSKITFDLYISQDEEYMAKTFGHFNDVHASKRLDPPTEIIPYNPAYGNTFYFSAINGNSPMTMGPGSTFSDAREALRSNEYSLPNKQGKVVAIKDIPLSATDLNDIIATGKSIAVDYKLDGLDKNQIYYIYIDVNIEQWDSLNNPVPQASLSSMLSSLLGVTTKGDKNIPDGEDKYPPAPILDKKDVGLDTATIFWDVIVPTEVGEVMEYEIIRIKDMQMQAKYLDSRMDFDLVWKDHIPENSEYEAFRTDGTDLYIADENGEFTTLVDPEKYVYNPDSGVLYFTDNSLTPNEVYFYYVRTVRTFKTKVFHSVWSDISVTTTPIQAPKNLVAETFRKDYDPKTEIIISFDAPLSDLNALGDILDLQYQIKRDNDEWQEHVTMDAKILKESATASDEEGYFHFVYKITGLEASSPYSVRVRMKDNKDSYSMYSNIATFRTDTNQEETDDDKALQDWLDYLKLEMEKLFKNPYWILRDDPEAFETLYRPSMFSAVLSENTTAQIVLPMSKMGDNRRHVYYIPASVYKLATDSEKGFVASNENMQVLIPPGAVDLNNNFAALGIGEPLKHNKLDDYFVRITLIWSPNAGPDGNNPLSQILETRFDIVGSSQDIDKWDTTILNLVREKVEKYSSDKQYREEFLKSIKNDSSNQDLSRYVLGILNVSEGNLINVISSKLPGFLKAEYPIQALDKPIMILVSNIDEATIVNALQFSAGGWMPKEVVPFGQNKGIYTTEPGIFAFTGKVINIPGIEWVENGGNITGIAAKYGLDDFLGIETIDMDAVTTRAMIIASVSRMAGAPRGTDPAKWLKSNKNIVVSSRNLDTPISVQESLYLMMVVYETKTGANVSTMKIRNQNSTANIVGLDKKYKQSVKAALEIGLYPSEDFDPRATITIGEMLDMLGFLDSKTKI